MYDVTMRWVRGAIFATEKQSVLHILSVFVHSGARHAMRMRRIATCDLSCSAVNVHIISRTARFPKKKSYWK
jgi:hypothetical protein